MSKRSGVFDVQIKTAVLKTEEPVKEGMTVEKGLSIIHQQMKLNGYRERTLNDYNLIFSKFVEITGVEYLDEITIDTIYTWLNSMEVSQSTKSTRLKCLKAVLSKFYNNGWYQAKFWLTVQIKLDKKVKKGTKQNDLNILLSLLDTSTFIGLRDAVAVLTLYKTGIRIKTLGDLKESNIDFQNKVLSLEGSIMKNHNYIKLPLDDQLIELYSVLIEQNSKIRTYYKQENDFLFITMKGKSINGKSTNNAIQSSYTNIHNDMN